MAQGAQAIPQAFFIKWFGQIAIEAPFFRPTGTNLTTWCGHDDQARILQGRIGTDRRRDSAGIKTGVTLVEKDDLKGLFLPRGRVHFLQHTAVYSGHGFDLSVSPGPEQLGQVVTSLFIFIHDQDTAIMASG